MSRGCQVQAGKATGVRHVARVFSADCGRRCGCCIDRTSLRKAELQLKRCTWSASRLATCAAQMRGGTEPNRTREVAVRGTAARTQSSHKFGGASAAFDWSRVRVAWRETSRKSSVQRGPRRRAPPHQTSNGQHYVLIRTAGSARCADEAAAAEDRRWWFELGSLAWRWCDRRRCVPRRRR